MNHLGSLLVVTILALVHLMAGRLRLYHTPHRRGWLSFAAGVSLAYVFVHILPELADKQDALQHSMGISALGFLEHHAYLMALAGFVVFYGLERFVQSHEHDSHSASDGDSMDYGVFWLNIGAFAVYNGLIGYLTIHRLQTGIAPLILWCCAFGLHFTVNDYGLRRHHPNSYDRLGRWVLSAAVLVGWAIGVATHISEMAEAVLFAFLAGSIIINVIKEELPSERGGRFWPLMAGAAGYATLLLATY